MIRVLRNTLKFLCIFIAFKIRKVHFNGIKVYIMIIVSNKIVKSSVFKKMYEIDSF